MALQSMLWGSSYFFIAVCPARAAGLTIAALRTIPASAAPVAHRALAGYRLPATLAEWRLFIVFSAFNTVLPFLLIVWGQARATAAWLPFSTPPPLCSASSWRTC